MDKKTIVVVGGGFGGVYAAKFLIRYFRGNNLIDIVLISKDNYFVFTPMLHEVATGGLNIRCVAEPIREAIKGKNFHFVMDEVEKIDMKIKEVHCRNFCVPFDYVVVASGSTSHHFGVPGAKEHTLPLKSLADAVRIKNHVVKQFELATRRPTHAKEALTFVIVGGGPTGVELAADLKEFVSQLKRRAYHLIKDVEPRVILCSRAPQLMKESGEKISRLTEQELAKKGVELMLGADIVEVTKSGVKLSAKGQIESNSVLWTAGVIPNKIKTIPELHNDKGHLEVTSFLHHAQESRLYAIGDCAQVIDQKTGKPIPKLAQAALAEAKHVARNIFERVTGGQMEPFVFKQKGFLVSIGSKYAIADIKGFIFRGFFAWWLWRTIYLFKLLSFKNKLRTAFDWTIDLFYDRDITVIK